MSHATDRAGRAARHPVLLHGFTGSSASWGERVVDGLAAAGLAPVLVDLPGHGVAAARTGAPRRVTLDDAFGALAAAGSWPTDLVGYSMGGRVALHFAAAHPERVRKLVLESASPGLETHAEREARLASDEALADFLIQSGIEAFVERWETQPLFATRAAVGASELARQRELRLQNDPAGLAAALRGLGTGALPSLWKRLGEIRIPTLLLVGALDRKFVEIARRMAAAMPDARVVEVEGAGHTVHLERPTDWLGAVCDFLSRS
jgi:2-succinyl-6-hydroxy-2,4-cyclohexadiene-1-carboxylate synthase